MRKHENEKGAVLIEVMVSLFITAMVFIAVYTTISVSLVNTRYLQQTKETSGFASQLAEAFYACAESDAYTMFDYISETHTDVPGATEIDLGAVQQKMNAATNSVNATAMRNIRFLGLLSPMLIAVHYMKNAPAATLRGRRR